MFRYGLVGIIATYGVIAAIFGYIGYELNNIIEISPKIDNELASQVLNSSKSPNISIDAKTDMKRAAAKQILQDYQTKKKDPIGVFEQIEQKQSLIQRTRYLINLFIMSYLYFGTLPSSVCTFESNTKQMEIIHPSWPSMWPRMLTDGKSIDFGHTPMHQDSSTHYTYMRPLTKKIKHYLWECEEEKFFISLKSTDRHTSWDTTSVSNLSLV